MIQLFIPIIFPDITVDESLSPVVLVFSITLYMILCILGVYFRLEETLLTSKEIALIAIYSAFSAVARIPFMIFPSVQPCTYLVFCAGYVFGPLIGFVIGANTALLSNIVLGQGTWTIYQIFGWGLTGVIGGILNRTGTNQINKKYHLLFGLLWGFLYGWLMNLWSWILLVRPMTFESWLLLNLNSALYDLAHGIGNVLFLYYFEERTINILYRYRQRFLVKIDDFIELSKPI